MTSEPRTARMHSSERASMIALVMPAPAAIARKVPLRVWRLGMPKDVFEAPQVVLRSNSSLIASIVLKK